MCALFSSLAFSAWQWELRICKMGQEQRSLTVSVRRCQHVEQARTDQRRSSYPAGSPPWRTSPASASHQTPSCLQPHKSIPSNPNRSHSQNSTHPVAPNPRSLTELVVLVRWESRGAQLGEHLRRVLERVLEVVGVLRPNCTVGAHTEEGSSSWEVEVGGRVPRGGLRGRGACRRRSAGRRRCPRRATAPRRRRRRRGASSPPPMLPPSAPPGEVDLVGLARGVGTRGWI